MSVLRKMCKLRKMCNKQNVGMKQICVEEEENCMCINQNVSIKQMCVGKVKMCKLRKYVYFTNVSTKQNVYIKCAY